MQSKIRLGSWICGKISKVWTLLLFSGVVVVFAFTVIADGAPSARKASEAPQYFLESEVSDGRGRSLGKFYVCVLTKQAKEEGRVSFEVYFPDSGQVVYAENLSASNFSSADNTKLEFRFTDNWGNKGVGTFAVDQVGAGGMLDLNPTDQVSDVRGRNAVRQYGNYELKLNRCTPTKRQLTIQLD